MDLKNLNLNLHFIILNLKASDKPNTSKGKENSSPKFKNPQRINIKNQRKFKKPSPPTPTVLDYLGLQRRKRCQTTFQINNKKREKRFLCAICREVFYHKVHLLKHKVMKHLKQKTNVKIVDKGNIDFWKRSYSYKIICSRLTRNVVLFLRVPVKH